MTHRIQTSIEDHVFDQRSIREEDGKWHPSSLAFCDRSSIYAKTGQEPSDPHSIKSQKNLFLGTEMHKIVQDAIRADERIPGHIEIGMAENPYNVAGTADGLLWDMTDEGTPFVLEIKTKAEFMWKKMVEPDPDHILQVTPYVMILRDHGGVATSEDGLTTQSVKPTPGLRWVRFVYLSKGISLDVKEFDVQITEEMEDRFREKITTLDGYLRDGVLPDRLERDSWQCKYCQFASVCWNK
jgi:CRISPR/Cas system-associated exonuclease Cas4 (RecB family)